MAHVINTSKIKTAKQKSAELDKAFEIDSQHAKSKVAVSHVMDANKGYKKMKE